MKVVTILTSLTLAVMGLSGLTWNSHTGTLSVADASAQMYKPPFRGAPASRVGGGTRGDCRPSTLSLSVLTPLDKGLTMQEQPSLYWYLSEGNALYPVEINLIDETSVKPLFEARLQPPLKAGMHEIRLADYNIHLTPGVDYRWSVALICDPENRSKDIVGSSGIERLGPTDERVQTLQKQLSQVDEKEKPRLYAQAGLFYDAVSELSELIAATPQDTSLRQMRATLLEEVALPDVAKYDKQH